MVLECIHFFVNELLWMLGWGWYQLVCSVFFLWIAYIFIARMKVVYSLVLAIAATAFAGIIYFCIVAGLFVYSFQWKFMNTKVDVLSPLHASLALASIYSVLQLFFYAFIAMLRPIPVFFFFLISLISNVTAAVLATYFIKVAF